MLLKMKLRDLGFRLPSCILSEVKCGFTVVGFLKEVQEYPSSTKRFLNIRKNVKITRATKNLLTKKATSRNKHSRIKIHFAVIPVSYGTIQNKMTT